MIRGSLPNLRSELLADNSGDSTESLLDEAEDYLRRSIDSMLTLSTAAAAAAVAAGEHCSGRHSARRRRARRHSEPDLFREWNPPQDARPYLPKVRSQEWTGMGIEFALRVEGVLVIVLDSTFSS